MARITLDADRLRIQHGLGTETSLGWDEIYSIHISKIEIPLASPVTYLTFDTQYGENIEVNDSDIGWGAALTNLGEHIGKSQKDLQSAVETISPEDGPVEIYAKSL